MNDTDKEDKSEKKIKTSSQDNSFEKSDSSKLPDLSNTKGYNPHGLIDGMKKRKEEENN